MLGSALASGGLMSEYTEAFVCSCSMCPQLRLLNATSMLNSIVELHCVVVIFYFICIAAPGVNSPKTSEPWPQPLIWGKVLDYLLS